MLSGPPTSKGNLGAPQETLTSLLYKGGRFQFSRLESLLEQAARSPGRSTLSNSSPQTGTSTASGLEVITVPEIPITASRVHVMSNVTNTTS